ncbi:hypothetical protein [Asanoa iriomotensis]|uniref:Uncharacterized protein n=1 Tax=Asanoa iriomotensis TaxID=234613 RepID=A0ABQ4BZZ2_9ACTN|nr:hypothetical protein [Asanoa iriomotensis]GIF56082.1 hypothetical protein Air01nite_21770 [Asanoa iriomotensis]
MIDSLLDRAASVLERRFLTNAFLPVLLLPPAVLTPAFLQVEVAGALLDTWNRLTVGPKILFTVGYFALSWFGATIVASQWRNIIRLFEGYPLARFRHAYQAAAGWHRDQSTELNAPANDRFWYTKYWAYPTPNAALPTRLGNVLRAAELYPLDRYHADVILIWPRLQHVLPRERIDDVEEARSTLEFLLVVALWFAAFATLAPVGLYVTDGDVVVAGLCFVLGLGASYAAYLSAISAAAEYGEHIRATFEMYRFDLLRRLRALPVRTPDEERDQWRELADFFGRNTPLAWRYADGESDDPPGSTPIRSAGVDER